MLSAAPRRALDPRSSSPAFCVWWTNSTCAVVRRRIASYAGADQALRERAEALEALEPVAGVAMAPMVAKEQYAEAQRRSRGQVDRRGKQP